MTAQAQLHIQDSGPSIDLTRNPTDCLKSKSAVYFKHIDLRTSKSTILSSQTQLWNLVCGRSTCLNLNIIIWLKSFLILSICNDKTQAWPGPARLIIYTRKPDPDLIFLTHSSLTHYPIRGLYQSSTAMLIFYKNYLSARNLVEKRSFPEFVRTFVFTHSHIDNAEIIINV